MFDFIKRLFGEGVLHFTFNTADGRGGTGKISYIGEYDQSAMELEIRQQIKEKHKVAVTKLEITEHIET